jgi:hypothetical protein
MPIWSSPSRVQKQRTWYEGILTTAHVGANFGCPRSMNEELLASHPPLIYGPTTAPSRRRLPMIPTSFESKYTIAGFLSFPVTVTDTARTLSWCRIRMMQDFTGNKSLDDG